MTWITDPIDGTDYFKDDLPHFGTIHGLYHKDTCVAGAIYNVKKDIMCIATLDGYKHVGKEDKVDSGVIYLGFSNQPREDIITCFKKEFPENKIVIFPDYYDPLITTHVFEGVWDGIFVESWSRHDLAAAPIMALMTGTNFTDHKGNDYSFIDPMLESRKLNSKQFEIIYSMPTVIAKPGIHERMLNVLKPFKEELDMIQKQGQLF